MSRIRIIPTLLMREGGLVKTIKFSNERYVGDPINAVKIFNEKEVDELVLLDIGATKSNVSPSFHEISEIVSEAFMPIGYGGGITTLQDIEQLFKIGVEKIILNSIFFKNAQLISEAANIFGSQSIVLSLDVKKDLWGNYRLYSCAGSRKEKIDLPTALTRAQDLGAGEVIINSIDRDGTMLGYDINLIKIVSDKLKIPLVTLGGAGTIEHLAESIRAGSSAVAAGSMFIFQGVHRAVLISYINSDDLHNYL
jgi:cyclase